MTKNRAGETRWRRWWWACGPLLALLAFLPSLATYFTGEDFIFVHFAASGKPFWESSQNLFYRPLPNLLWQFDYSLWGLQAAGYHLTNLLLHAANATFVGLLARKATGSGRVAVLSAALFALHPIHTEPVTWLAGRPDLLATFFVLASLLAWLKALEENSWLFYLLSLLAFAAGMFSKESSAGLPAVLFVWAILRARPRNRAGWIILGLKILPFVAVVALYLGARLLSLGVIGGYNNEGRDLFFITWNATFGTWLPLLFPANLESAGPLLGGAAALLLLLLYSWLGFTLWRVRPRSLPGFWLAISLIYGSLLPALDTSPVQPNLLQARILYLPSAGFCLLLALAINALYPSQVPTARYRARNLLLLFPGFAAVYLLSLAIALVPWIQAGSMVNDTFALLRNANPGIKAGDTVYYEGLPDSFHGAYLWRNGLDDATALLVGPTVDGFHRTDDLLVDYRRTQDGHLWFARYSLNQSSATLSYVFGYAVGQQAPATFQKRVRWNFSSCSAGGWKWELLDGRLECAAGQGFLSNLQDQKTSLQLHSPDLALPEKQLKLSVSAYINYDFQQPQVFGELVVTGAGNQEYFRQPFDLAADGRSHYYNLFARLPQEATGPFQVTIKLNKIRTNVLWQEISLD